MGSLRWVAQSLQQHEVYIGIMSGTSLDGVDAVLVTLDELKPALIESVFLPFDASLRQDLLDLHQSGYDELNRAALLGNHLSRRYADAVHQLLARAKVRCDQVVALGCHGQTIRHCPENEKQYTIQLVNGSLLAELTGITVVTDFRNRDIAAGGQGAPLVPAFHRALFAANDCHRVIVNIGGIANITNLESDGRVTGFDCGPGNMLMDAWCFLHRGEQFDRDGAWAKSGQVIPALLDAMLREPFFAQQPPKSTGRELFNLSWLKSQLSSDSKAEDVQATLLQLTALSITQAIRDYCITAKELYFCGGGAHNAALMQQLAVMLPDRQLMLTDQLGVAADWVEAFAFAWLALQTVKGRPGNLPLVTGASGARILGAIYPV